MDDLEPLVKSRMTTMAAGTKIGSDAIAKSLRCYETRLHPFLKERLSIWWEELHDKSTTKGTTFRYDKDVEGLHGSRLMNYVFQGFYMQEPTTKVDVIYPRLSRTTATWKSDRAGTVIRDDVEQWLRSFHDEEEHDTVSLRALADQELGTTITRDILDNTLHSSLNQGICHLLLRNDFVFPSDEFVTVKSRRLDPDLIMKVRYYPSRDDNRAYCTDGSRLRSLVGSCLHRMFSPKDKRLKRQLHSATIVHHPKKDMLDIKFFSPPHQNENTYLLLADISNFTGSFANSWLLAFAMGLEVACGKLEDRYQLFSVGDQILNASWKELLLLYTYLTVGVPCWVEEQQRYAYLSGGFLGVNCNITMGLVCLAAILQDLAYRFSTKVTDFRVQAGGDDIAIILRCNDTDLEEIRDIIKRELEAYVGKVKELNVFILDNLENGVVEDAKFCKKRVIIRNEDVGVHLTSEPSVPIPKTLFPSVRLRGFRAQRKAWRDLDNSLRVFEDIMPGHSLLTDTLRQLFLEHYRGVKPRRTRSEKYLTSSHRVIRLDGISITDEAHKVACQVRAVQQNGVTALSDYSSKVRHALKLNLITVKKIRISENSNDLITMTKSEAARLSTVRWREEDILLFDEDLLDELIDIVN